MTRHLLALSVLAIVASACSTPTSATLPLSITCPSVPVATSLTGSPVLVSYSAPTVKNGTTTLTATCLPQSGAAFSVGTTTVTCQTPTTAERVASCSFGVTVREANRLAHTRYLSFGDSITAGTISAPITSFSPRFLEDLALWSPEARDAFFARTLITDNPQAYPAVLQTRLSARYPQQAFQVLNDGDGGEYAAFGADKSGAERLPGSLAANAPEVLLLMEGTNDMGGPSGPDAAIVALTYMVQLAQSQGRKVVLATIAPIRPVTDHRAAQQARVPAFNDRIRALAASRNVPLVDIYKALESNMNRYIGVDGLHPTVQGYEAIADAFAETIRTAFEQGGGPVVNPK